MNRKAMLAIFGVFLGCCSNVVFLEMVVRYDPGAGHLVTFSQFFFIACYGLIFMSKCFTVKPVIAMRDYVTLVVMFFVSNVCNNYAFNFHIPMPLHMIFRAGSLMANMVMGIIILKKSYDIWKYISVILITLGIIVCTISSGSSLKNTKGPTETDSFGILFWWSIGISLLTVALFVSARMGIYQETLYKKYGKHPNEALFFTHALPLPGFVLLYKSIATHSAIAIESEPNFIFGIGIPIQVLSLVGSMVTQYLCISSVYVLTTECPSLTVTLVVTLRKFASLLFSIVYFKNPFTTYHWIGTSFVFIGTVIFTELLPSFKSRASDQQSAENATLKSDIQDSALKIYKKLFASSILKTTTKNLEAPHIKYQRVSSDE